MAAREHRLATSSDIASTLVVGGAVPRRARIGTVALAGASVLAAARTGRDRRPMRIAVVGAGVSGLVCAHLLHEEHDVTVFEANDYAGGHTNTVRVDTADETHHVDTGFIVHNDRNYPYFMRLLESVGVATQPSQMSFSVSDGRGGLEYNGSSANGLFANRANLVRPRSTAWSATCSASTARRRRWSA